MSRFQFPRWSNLLLPVVILVGATVPVYAAFFVSYGFSPKTLDVGYQPTQPIPFSHALHAGQLGLDCRYCHIGVDRGASASIPVTQTCMNCHTNIRPESPKLATLIDSNLTGMPVEWIRIHRLPDFAFFNHAAHVTRGVGCATCHGRIDKMEVVYQHAPLSMGWCLECHREPITNLRSPSEVTNMRLNPALDVGIDAQTKLRAKYQIAPSENCTTCHR